ncbi:hypothetical protein [Tenacibaculum soleae]|uniref:DNA topoisomerase IV n=1 Tax=Tenacibaculum soleae TaxID=447689 RepID=A0A1B9XYM3_9FLAO|nr:hypothetical protein [Tenacibaculum soleae]MDO6743907.1 hypothetical protein [Tenacibaculum soleae]MDO6812314.1 hypothetical protein [Tenacibaculum soleae]OCK42629.1 hypothetical protein BA195_10680 [Tenacibaculum soleae]
MRYLLSFLVVFLVYSCTPEKKGDPKRFVYGTFEIPAGDNYGKTTIVRKDSLQIEEYSKKVSISTDSLVTEKEVKHIDTLFIKWKNNFAYSLRMKTPKTDLDKDPIFVQITQVTDSSYNFTAKIGYSNFKQKGTVYKVD